MPSRPKCWSGFHGRHLKPHHIHRSGEIEKFHKYMRDGINAFLDTDFSEDDMELIYTYMGLACDRWLTLMFIDHDMSIEWLKEHVS